MNASKDYGNWLKRFIQLNLAQQPRFDAAEDCRFDLREVQRYTEMPAEEIDCRRKNCKTKGFGVRFARNGRYHDRHTSYIKVKLPPEYHCASKKKVRAKLRVKRRRYHQQALRCHDARCSLLHRIKGARDVGSTFGTAGGVLQLQEGLSSRTTARSFRVLPISVALVEEPSGKTPKR